MGSGAAATTEYHYRVEAAAEPSAVEAAFALHGRRLREHKVMFSLVWDVAPSAVRLEEGA